MNIRRMPVIGFGIVVLMAAVLVACDSSTSVDAPADYEPLIETVTLTPQWDAGSPVPLRIDGDEMILLFTSTYGGTGDIYTIPVSLGDTGFYDTVPESLYFSTPTDSFIGPAAERFTNIGFYEVPGGEPGQDVPNYPGVLSFKGPRQLHYDEHSDRVFYSMGYEGMSEIASTVAPGPGVEADVPLDEIFNVNNTREPHWEFWYTKVERPGDPEPSWAFTGGYYVSVSRPNSFGEQYVAYSDTLLESYDRDWDDGIGEDPVGSIEVVEEGLDDDGMPGYAGVDDDEDGNADMDDTEVASMSMASPSQGSSAWNMQNYNGVFDDDEDGLMEEDGPDGIDNDGDGRIDEDQTGDMGDDGLPGWLLLDPDDDGLLNWDDREVRHATLRAESFALNGYDPAADDDEDGIVDEDADLYRDGIWVVKTEADGMPDETAVPISLSNDGGRQPFFNPVNEEELLYVAGGDIHRLTLAYEAGSASVVSSETLVESVELDSYPAYSDDGSRIVYVSSTEGTADIWIMNADGSGAERVTNAPGQELFPRFTPAGDQIVYEAWLWPDGHRRVMITVESLP